MTEPKSSILLVEDDKAYSTILQHRLTEKGQCGFHVEPAASLKQAVGLAKRKPFDIAWFDLTLPDSQGLDTFETFRTEITSVPIMVLLPGVRLAGGMRVAERLRLSVSRLFFVTQHLT